MLYEFWHNFTHNLFKPLLLFFYLGFLIPVLRVKFEFPYVIYQGLTLYLLLAIGWHGGEELAGIDPSSIANVAGFVVVGFFTNLVIGFIAYWLLSRMTSLRKIDRATVAGYYGSDSAGTFATCVGVLAAVGMAFDAYMPVMLAVMEIPGALVALLLVARLRQRGLDAAGNAIGEPGHQPGRLPESNQPPGVGGGDGGPALVAALSVKRRRSIEEEIEEELEFSLEQPTHRQEDRHYEPAASEAIATATPQTTPAPPTTRAAPTRILTGALLREVLLNPGLYLLFGGMAIGFISGLQGSEVTRSGDVVFVTAFQGLLCLFLLEMGMTAARKLRDLRDAGRGFVAFGLLAPNLFAGIGLIVIHSYAHLTRTDFEPGTYVLFAVLCGAASYIAVPAVQRMAIPEASPTLPLAASLGLTFAYNVTIGIPIYIQLATALNAWLPVA